MIALIFLPDKNNVFLDNIKDLPGLMKSHL